MGSIVSKGVLFTPELTNKLISTVRGIHTIQMDLIDHPTHLLNIFNNKQSQFSNKSKLANKNNDLLVIYLTFSIKTNQMIYFMLFYQMLRNIFLMSFKHNGIYRRFNELIQRTYVSRHSLCYWLNSYHMLRL